MYVCFSGQWASLYNPLSIFGFVGARMDGRERGDTSEVGHTM